jgi:DNA-binding response OmpR family regulator
MDLHGIRVLVAERSPVKQSMARKALLRLGCDVRVASSSSSALKCWDSTEFDLVLMDCQMPEAELIETTRQIRRSSVAGAMVPIIALTGGDSESERDQALLAGVSDFLPKPLHPKSLEAALHRVLFHARRHAEAQEVLEAASLRAAAN